jgi:hypothetical protein
LELELRAACAHALSICAFQDRNFEDYLKSHFAW